MTEVISYRSDWRTNPFAVLPSISAKLPSQKTVALDRVGPVMDEDIEAPGVEAQRRRRDRPDHSRSSVIEACRSALGLPEHPTPGSGDSRLGRDAIRLRTGPACDRARVWCGSNNSPLWERRPLGRPFWPSNHPASASSANATRGVSMDEAHRCAPWRRRRRGDPASSVHDAPAPRDGTLGAARRLSRHRVRSVLSQGRGLGHAGEGGVRAVPGAGGVSRLRTPVSAAAGRVGRHVRRGTACAPRSRGLNRASGRPGVGRGADSSFDFVTEPLQ